MILYFLRHGDAVRDSRIHDSERPLSNLGEERAVAVGRFLFAGSASIQNLLCSPLLRARQTAAAVLRDSKTLTVRTTEHLTPSSDPRNILRELSELNGESVLIVGHEPHLSATISLLLAGDERSRVMMLPCTLACLSSEAPPEPDKAQLRWLIHAEQIMDR